MPIKINWEGQHPKKALYFNDLPLNTAFKNAGELGKGAIYLKCAVVAKRNNAMYTTDNNEYYMYEVQTGKLFKPTESPVEVVELEVNIGAKKPALYENVDIYSQNDIKYIK